MGKVIWLDSNEFGTKNKRGLIPDLILEITESELNADLIGHLDITAVKTSVNQLNSKTFHFDLPYQFCLEFKDYNEFKEHFHTIFSINYYFKNECPIVFVKTKPDSEDFSLISQFLLDQGYSTNLLFSLPTLSSNERIVNLDKNFNMKTYFDMIRYDRLLFCSNHQKLVDFNESVSGLINADENLSEAMQLINLIISRNLVLNKKIAWTENQLNNHKHYLSVIKALIKNDSGFTYKMPNNFVIRLLKKSGSIRKFGKYILNKIR